MNTTTWQGSFIVAALVGALVAAPASASPLYIGGSFTGIAVGAHRLPLNSPPPHPVSYYEGAPVTGAFEVFVPNPQPVPWRDDGFSNQDGWLSLSLTVGDEIFAYDIALPDPGPPGPAGTYYPSVIEMSPSVDGGPQSVSFRTWWIYRYSGAGFALTGPEGSLFDGLDPHTLHVDPTQPLAMSAAFSSSNSAIAMVVDIRQFTLHTLNEVTQPLSEVPEPSTLLLVLLGLSVLAAPHVRRATSTRWRWPRRAAASMPALDPPRRSRGQP